MKLVTRAQWGARPPKNTPSAISPSGVTQHYEGPHMGSFPHSSCATKVRGIQNFHMDGRGWSDIAYNFIPCPHGYVFEGRGLGRRSAANGTNAGNSAHLASCALMGEGDPVPDDLLHACRDVIDHARSHGTGSEVKGHRDWKATACPGSPLYAWVRSGASRPGPTPEPEPEPEPPEDDMPAPAIVYTKTGQWTFVRGVDGQLHGRKDNAAGNLIPWRPFGGVCTSGPDAAAYERDGRSVVGVTVRGGDAAAWQIDVWDDGGVAVGWRSLGGLS